MNTKSTQTSTKIKYLSTSHLLQLEKADVYLYIKRLHKLLLKQSKILKCLQRKLCTRRSNEKSSPSSIVGDIIKAAEDAQNMTEFVYEPTSGLYYDKRTGYYYNAELGLYYDGNHGCYYTYNQETKEFAFQSYAQEQYVETEDKKVANEIVEIFESDCEDKNSDQDIIPAAEPPTLAEQNGKSNIDEKSGSIVVDDDTEIEEGELREKRSSKKKKKAKKKKKHSKQTEKYLEIPLKELAQKYPPALRLIVTETNCAKLKVGSLFIVTYKGGTLGREGDHEVLIPDINVSKYHLKFVYNKRSKNYEVVDFGSRNGSILNGKRISTAKNESEPVDLLHGSEIILSQTKLLCHIHEGYTTCNECEPGVVSAAWENQNKVVVKQPEKVVETHKSELKRIKKKYGLETEDYIENPSIDSKNYNDRAGIRRKAVGSSNPNEKTQMASLDTSISSDNKGFKMLAKLGWSAGQKLGKNEDGLEQPIPMNTNMGTVGLGYSGMAIPKIIQQDKKQMQKNCIWKKTQERMKQIQRPDIFDLSEDEDE